MTGKGAVVMPTLSIPPGPTRTAEQAKAIFRRAEEAAVFALLWQVKMLAEQAGAVSANTFPAPPSRMKLFYEEPGIAQDGFSSAAFTCPRSEILGAFYLK